MSLPPADWYADPAQQGRQRYWNGASWTDTTRSPAASPPPLPPQQPDVNDPSQFQTRATFQPQAQAGPTLQPQTRAALEPQAQPRPTFQPQAQAPFQPAAMAWSPGVELSPRRDPVTAVMPWDSRDAYARDLHVMTPGFAPGVSTRMAPTPSKQRTRARSAVPIGLAIAVVSLVARFGVPALIDAFNGPSRTLTASDVIAPTGWEVRSSPSGAVAFAFDPRWAEARDLGDSLMYREDADSQGTQFTELAGNWALAGSLNSPRTRLLVVAKSRDNGTIDLRTTAETWLKEAATDSGGGSPTVLTSEAFVSGRGYDGWHMEYSISASSSVVYLDEFLIVDSDTILVVACMSTDSTSKWHDDLRAVTNSAVIVASVRAPTQA